MDQVGPRDAERSNLRLLELPGGPTAGSPAVGVPALVQDSAPDAGHARMYDGTLWSCGRELEDPARRTCFLVCLCPGAAFGSNKQRVQDDKRASIFWGVLFSFLVFAPFVALLTTFERKCDSPMEEHTCHLVVDVDKLKYRVGLGSAICFVPLVTVGAWSRVHTRRKFSIEGPGCFFQKTAVFEDVLAWTFCACCALCQETRTLVHNNVKRGVWHGPEAVAVDLPSQPAAGVPVTAPPQIDSIQLSQVAA
eukprot:evm.model.scf_175.6 EVM.evm.TU.scf_175.6   scf_175:125850-128317(-)